MEEEKAPAVSMEDATKALVILEYFKLELVTLLPTVCNLVSQAAQKGKEDLIQKARV